MWPFSPLVTFLAAGAVAASLASGVYGYSRGVETGDRKIEKIYAEARRRQDIYDQKIQGDLEDYRESIAAANARRPKRVFCTSPDDLPQAASGTADSAPAGSDRQPDGTDLGGKDYGPDLREARDDLIRCRTLIGVVK